jgi:hypothetical protein
MHAQNDKLIWFGLGNLSVPSGTFLHLKIEGTHTNRSLSGTKCSYEVSGSNKSLVVSIGLIPKIQLIEIHFVFYTAWWYLRKLHRHSTFLSGECGSSVYDSTVK